MRDAIPRCDVDGCGGIVKPDITFFGEDLPRRFHDRLSDLEQADLLIVIGTSLAVMPFAALAGMVGPDVPRVLINRECVGGFGEEGPDGPYRDAVMLGDLQDSVATLVAALGWTDDMQKK